MGTVVILSGVKRPERELTSRLPRLKISVTISLLLLRAFMARAGTLSLLEQFIKIEQTLRILKILAYPKNSGVFDSFSNSLKRKRKKQIRHSCLFFCPFSFLPDIFKPISIHGSSYNFCGT
jgi:hypothetical protein